MKYNFNRLFKPKSIAVVGVSLSNDRHPANVIFQKLLLRYPVRAYAINPKGGNLQREKIYPDFSALPEKVDHAVIAVRAEQVEEVLHKAIAGGAGGATIVSGGFVEAAARCAKPVIVLKAGKSAAGSRAVASHTASLAGDYAVFSQIMAQFGIAEACNEYELISFCEALSR
jgi:acyl-CoA synthetase (NDP forming)